MAKETIKLSLQETHLLEYLMRGNGRILTKEQILDKVWGFNNDVERSNVELYICYLRKKIDFEKYGLVTVDMKIHNSQNYWAYGG